MGHWERYLPIAHLAEAAGIRDAVEAFDFSGYEGPYSIFGGDLSFVCAVRGKHARQDGRTPIGPVGQLYACLYGDKYLVGGIYGHDLDWLLGPDDYSDYFEDIDSELVEKAKEERPELCEAARDRMNIVLNNVVYRSKAAKIESRATGLELRPEIAKFLLRHGPATYKECSRGVRFGGFCVDWYEILSELAKEGFLNSEYHDNDWFFSLTESANKMLEDYGPLEIPKTPEGKLLSSLREKGPLSSADIAFEIGMSVKHVRVLLRELIDEGDVEAMGRGSTRRYAAA